MANESRNVKTNRDGSLRSAVRLLDAQTSTGAGASHELGRAYSAFGLEYSRGSTTATLESTSASVQLQGRIGSTSWVDIGAAVTVNSQSVAFARSTNAIPVFAVRARIASFTTSAGAASTAERRVPVTMYLSAGFGSS